MEPLVDGAIIVGSHADLAACFGAFEVSTQREAEIIMEKLGFVQTVADTWCHPKDLLNINKCIANMAEEEASRLTLPD